MRLSLGKEKDCEKEENLVLRGSLCEPGHIQNKAGGDVLGSGGREAGGGAGI